MQAETALVFGVLIVLLLLTGWLWIMAHLSQNMMPWRRLCRCNADLCQKWSRPVFGIFTSSSAMSPICRRADPADRAGVAKALGLEHRVLAAAD